MRVDQLRADLVAGLLADGRIVSPEVARAFRTVPRHLFLPGVPVDTAYRDEAVATRWCEGVAVSSASQPSMMAIMLEQLGTGPGHRVLEIGAGTGYNAALMGHLVGPAGRVVAVDIDPDLVEEAARNLAAAGVGNVEVMAGDGALGHPDGAPFDRIVLTVGSWDIHPAWWSQLAPGGRLLLPLSVRGSQLSVALDLTEGPPCLLGVSVRGCAFVRLRGAGAGPETSHPLGGDGLTVQTADTPDPDPADLEALNALVDAPGPDQPSPVRLGAVDLWDGLGLWAAVHSPQVCRLLVPGDRGTAGEGAPGRVPSLLPAGMDGGTVALRGIEGPGGLAAVVPHGQHQVSFERRFPVAVRPYGPGGEELAARLAGLLETWSAAGRPSAAGLRLRAYPAGQPLPAVGPAATVLRKRHTTLVLDWPGHPVPAGAYPGPMSATTQTGPEARPADPAGVTDTTESPRRPSTSRGDGTSGGAGRTLRDQVHAAARRARVAAGELAVLRRAEKDRALRALAEALRAHVEPILAANAQDVRAGQDAGMASGLLDRLTLTEQRIEAIAGGLTKVATLPDPVGEVVRGATLANGLELRQIRVPMGVVGMVYEARPNVTVDAAGLALKSGNAVLLRGSSSTEHTNTALVEVMRAALTEVDVPADAVQLLPCEDRASVHHLITARGLVDLVIPRGGAGLISSVVGEATVACVETGIGNCHVYVDAHADLDMAERIIINSKVRRPSVCNAAETLLVHADVAETFVPSVAAALRVAGVTVHGDERFVALAPGTSPAIDEDWDAEYLSLDLAAAVVDSLDDAVAHIAAHGSGHTEAIVTADRSAARAFTARVDAAAIMVNASTGFTDGEEFGMGAEIGISTQKLHARGPMGLPELTTTKWIVEGDGHVRAG